MKGELIELYKIMKSIYRADNHNLYPRMEMSLNRGHMFRGKGDVQACISHKEYWYLERADRGSDGNRYYCGI